MAKTLETMIVKDPSPRVVAMLERMRVHKVTQLEKMRNLRSYDYEIRVKLMVHPLFELVRLRNRNNSVHNVWHSE